MTQMHFTTLDDALDEHFGKRGTSERDKFEADVEAAVNAYRIGEARLPIKTRKSSFESYLSIICLLNSILITLQVLKSGISIKHSKKIVLFSKNIITHSMTIAIS